MGKAPGQADLDRGAVAGDGADLEGAADQAGPLAHAGQAEMALAEQLAAVAGVEPNAVVAPAAGPCPRSAGRR